MVRPYGKQDNNLSASAIQTLPLNLMVKNCYCGPRCDDSLTFSVWNRDDNRLIPVAPISSRT